MQIYHVLKINTSAVMLHIKTMRLSMTVILNFTKRMHVSGIQLT